MLIGGYMHNYFLFYKYMYIATLYKLSYICICKVCMSCLRATHKYIFFLLFVCVCVCVRTRARSSVCAFKQSLVK